MGKEDDMKTTEQKLDKVLNLLTDKTWLKNRDNKAMFETEQEAFGGLVMLSHVFKKAYKIAKD